MDTQEVEWQFDAVDLRPVERWLRARADTATVEDGAVAVAEASALTQLDTYVDTPDWRVHRAGYSLRLRRRGRGATEATLKSFSPPKDGLRRRREITEALPSADPEGLLRSEGAVGERARAVAGGSALAPLFDVRTRRRAFDLSVGGVPAGEVLLDETTIPQGDGGPPARLKRVEVEVREPFEESLSAFVREMYDDCGLRPASLSKYEAGLLSRGMRPDGAPDLGSTDIDPSQSVGEVAFAVIRKHFQVFVAKEPGTRIGEDPEELHDMRVATRRLRAVLALFGNALPVRLYRVRDELGWVAGALGAVRDLDVQLEQLEAWSAEDLAGGPGAVEAVRELVERERDAARVELLRVLDSPRHTKLLDGLTHLLQTGPLKHSTASRAPIRSAAPALVRRHQRAMVKAGDRIGDEAMAEDYHRLRIRTKRLRYALESLAAVYPGETEPLVRRLVALQDLLGKQQDAGVASRRLESLATRDAGSLPPATVFAMGMMAERYAREGSRLRSRFPAAYRGVQAKAWRTLEQVMRRTPVGAAPSPAGSVG